jgi:tetratricopeptide (TPR) repeat protein
MARQTNSHIDSPVALGKRLREARRTLVLRQRDLSFDGCSISYISRLEKGERQPSLQLIEQLARRLGVTVEWLARGDTVAKPPVEDERLTQAEIALRLGETDDALSVLADIIAAAPSKPVAARAEALLGQAAFLSEETESAVDHLERALELDETLVTDPSTADTLGRAYARSGRMESAMALFRQNLELARDNADAREQLRFAVLLANTLIDSIELVEASTLLGEALTSNPTDDPLELARIYWTRSRLHAMNRETRLARRFARRTLELLEHAESLGHRSRAHQLMAFVELDGGNADAALDYIRRGRELAQQNGTGHHDEAKFAIEEARALVQLGRLDDAAAAALNGSAALRRTHHGDGGRSYTELAGILEQAGQAEHALELYELAIVVLEPTPNRLLADAYTARGELLERLGRHDDAYAAFKRAAHLNSELHQLEGRETIDQGFPGDRLSISR